MVVRPEEGFEGKQLRCDVTQVEQFDEDVESDEVVAITTATHEAEMAGYEVFASRVAPPAELASTTQVPTHLRTRRNTLTFLLLMQCCQQFIV